MGRYYSDMEKQLSGKTLPKWARTLLLKTASERDTLQERYDTLAAELPRTDTFVQGMGHDVDDIPLPCGARIKFKLDNAVFIARNAGDYLDVNVIGGILGIVPAAANTIRLRRVEKY